jgi:DNA-directed RNA polymerases I and III subunit RPAC1
MYKHIISIELEKNLKDENAKRVQDFFCKGVIGIDSKGKAFVDNPRLCNQSPDYLTGSEVADLVSIKRIPESFSFKIETVGYYNPSSVLIEACKVLRSKCSKHYQSL